MPQDSTKRCILTLLPILCIPFGSALAQNPVVFPRTAAITSSQTVKNAKHVIYAAELGMKCDGITDDTVAFTKALTFAATVPTRLVIQGGTCLISEANVRVPGNIHIQGAGKFATVIRQKNGVNQSSPMLLASGSNITISDLTLDGNSTNQKIGNDLFQFGNVSKISAINARFINAYFSGFASRNATNATATDILVENCDFEQNGVSSIPGAAGSILLNTASRVRIIGNRFDDKGSATSGQDIGAGGGGANASKNWEIRGNVFNNLQGFAIALGGGSPSSSHITISGNRIVALPSGAQNLIDVGTATDVVIEANDAVNPTNHSFVGDGPQALRVTVMNNRCIGAAGSSFGNSCVALGGSDLIISGNYLSSSGTSGIVITPGAGQRASNITIRKNVVRNSSQLTADTYPGIEIEGARGARISDVVIVGNRLYDVQSAPTQSYGVRINNANDVNPTNVTISGNDVRGNKSGGIQNLSRGQGFVILDNRGGGYVRIFKRIRR